MRKTSAAVQAAMDGAREAGPLGQYVYHSMDCLTVAGPCIESCPRYGLPLKREMAQAAEAEREDQLRQLLSYCRAEVDKQESAGEYSHELITSYQAYDDVVTKLAAILDGEQ